MDRYTEARSVVSAYLDALGSPDDRPATNDARRMLEAQLERNRTSAAKARAQPLSCLKFLEDQIDLEARLALVHGQLAQSVDELEAGFVKHARLYAERADVSAGAFERLGVSPDVLWRALA